VISNGCRMAVRACFGSANAHWELHLRASRIVPDACNRNDNEIKDNSDQVSIRDSTRLSPVALVRMPVIHMNLVAMISSDWIAGRLGRIFFDEVTCHGETWLALPPARSSLSCTARRQGWYGLVQSITTPLSVSMALWCHFVACCWGL